MSFSEVENLSYYKYALYRKEAWYANMRKSEEGNEFLKTLWRLNQTKADVKKVREKIRQQGGE